MTIKNNIEQEPFLWIDFEINNFDHFTEVVHSWDVDFLQLDGGSFYSELKQMILPEVQIGHTHFDCHLDQKGAAPKDMWTFVIMGEDASMFKFNHATTQSASTMVIYSPGQEINAVTYDGFHIYTLSIHRSHFQELTQKLGLDMIEEKLSKIDRVELDLEQADSLRGQLKDILDDASSLKHKVISPEGKKLLLNFLPMKFLKEIGSQVDCAKDKVVQERDMFFMEARAYMHTHLHEEITIEEIAKKFKLSERTLRNYFKEELNTSPKQYLIALRLTKIRDELKVSEMKKGSVEQTARRFGFHHMGQFSKAYKDFFGELPSETLKE
ncbi:helix-turn-helix domain-containing protein [Sulfurovum sp. CS9]|uniref:AraC family transcriptional regulator n=1 Tax=Sulfurovum sp. CS9 TaxID=3391146 RepID=UPI0039E9814C